MVPSIAASVTTVITLAFTLSHPVWSYRGVDHESMRARELDQVLQAWTYAGAVKYEVLWAWTYVRAVKCEVLWAWTDAGAVKCEV